MKKMLVALVFFCAALSLLIGPPAWAGKLKGIGNALEQLNFAPVPKTGQTQDFWGLLGIGDDAYWEKGVPWPTPRFRDNGNGTVTDNLTGLIWTKNAKLSDILVHRQTACEMCDELEDGDKGLTDGSQPGDWRLPNVRELQSLISYGCNNPALPNTEGTGEWTADNPFTEVQSYYYWSSTYDIVSETAYGWRVDFTDGSVIRSENQSGSNVWCVRGGK